MGSKLENQDSTVVCVAHSFDSGRARSFFFFTLDTGPRRSLILKLSDTRVYEPPNPFLYFFFFFTLVTGPGRFLSLNSE